MKVKDMISMLQKHNPDEEVIIRFALDQEDEFGYILETVYVGEYYNDCAIYGAYNTTKEDCEFIGQIDLAEAYKEYGKQNEKMNRIKKEVLSYIAVENRLKRKNIKPDSFDKGIFYISNNINEILKGNKDDN